MKTAFEIAYEEAVKKMTIARDYAEQKQKEINKQHISCFSSKNNSRDGKSN